MKSLLYFAVGVAVGYFGYQMYAANQANKLTTTTPPTTGASVA